jgi:hypothetical protein
MVAPCVWNTVLGELQQPINPSLESGAIIFLIVVAFLVCIITNIKERGNIMTHCVCFLRRSNVHSVPNSNRHNYPTCVFHRAGGISLDPCILQKNEKR